jgi:alanine racemase
MQNSIHIDLSALVQNLNQVKKLIGTKTKIMGIVKSDAYGHGIVQVSRILEQNGVDFLGVAHLAEALEIRKKGIKVPIVVLCGVVTRDEAMEAVDKDLRPVVFDTAGAELLAEEAARKGKEIHIQVKVDTGMGRLGIPHSETGAFLNRIGEYSQIHVEALASHLSLRGWSFRSITWPTVREQWHMRIPILIWCDRVLCCMGVFLLRNFKPESVSNPQ